MHVYLVLITADAMAAGLVAEVICIMYRTCTPASAAEMDVCVHPLTAGGFERLHYLIETFWDEDEEVNPSFIKSFEGWMPWDVNPLYALVHEAIYCQGAASEWAAQWVTSEQFAKDFDAVAAAKAGGQGCDKGVAR
jgi:hypothetical protein